MVAILLGGMLFIDLSADALFGFAWRPLAFAMTQNAMVLGFGLWLAGRLLTFQPDALTFGVADAQRRAAEPVLQSGRQPDDRLHRRLSTLMETDRIFLDPELDFAGFVERMGAPERAVRALIIHDLGYDHFRIFLNHHRIAEACRLLEDPGRSQDKLIGVALDSGFASLASFNRAFRSIQGCAPGAYRAAVRQEDGTSRQSRVLRREWPCSEEARRFPEGRIFPGR
ncbi:AraC family transcriptional regulator [Allosphingosinicella deserti]|nr:AraC family transcriptional regulator [Sphingomonas deserti]